MKPRVVIALALLFIVAGCDRDDVTIREQHAPKQLRAMASAEAFPTTQPEQKGFTYTAPPGWIEDGPKSVSLATFHIGENAQKVDIAVTPLPAGSGSFLENIKRWQGQVGLPLSKEGDPQKSEPVKVGGVDGNIFDFVSPGDAPQARRIRVAWVPKGTQWWFIRMIGPANLVAEQVGAFDSFVKSVKFTDGTP